jgi:sugar phosphate permease
VERSEVGRQGDARAARRGLVTAFAITWLAYATYYLGRKGFSVSKAAIARELGVGTDVLAGIDTAYLAAYAFGQVPSGVVADRFGPRVLVGFGLLASALACAAFGLAHGALALALCFGLNGLAQSTGWPGTTQAMATWTTPANRGRVMGVWSTCYQVGGVAATALATYALAREGWRAAFFWPAICLGGMGVLVLMTLRPRPRAVLPTDAPASEPRAPRPQSIYAEAKSALRVPALYSYGAAYFCIKLIRYSLLFWLPYYLHTAAGLDEVESGYLSTSFELGGVLGSIGLGVISDRAQRRGVKRARSAAVSLLLLAIALVAYARLGQASMLVHFALMALIGALLFGPDALISGAAAQDAGGEAQAATAVGVVNGMGSLGALLQGALTVSVQQAFGWNALFYVFFALALLACVCLVPAIRVTSSTN